MGLLVCLRYIVVVRHREYLENRHEEDFRIEREREPVDVLDVEFDPLGPRDLFPAVDLRPARHARPHVEHPFLVLGILFVRPGVIGQSRTRSDERHVAFEDVDQLRQLVDARGADDSADTCNPAVALNE